MALRRGCPGDEELAEERLNERFEMFELAQPALAAHVGDSLNRTRDDLAIALGYFLTLIIWLAFEEIFDDQLEQIDELECKVSSSPWRSMSSAAF